MKIFVKKAAAMALMLIASAMATAANNNMDTSLNAKQRGIIGIAAHAGKGDLAALKTSLHAGLDVGLTINQAKEALVHLYAYAGFPRSIRGLQTLMAVLEERKAKGIQDPIGPVASPITDARNKYDRGKDVLGKLTGAPQEIPKTGYGAFSPEIDTFLKEHLFADLFERDVLSHTERELVTISVLSAIGGVEPMLTGHFNICLNIGITPTQLQQFVVVIREKVGEENAASAQSVLTAVLENKSKQ